LEHDQISGTQYKNLKVLIVEDDAPIAGQVMQEVINLGWESTTVETVQAARAQFANIAFDLVVLDRMLGDSEDGLALISWFNELESTVPGILVASRLGTVQDHILALDLGADDYINKPYDLEELNARLRALARRMRGKRAPESVDVWENLEIRTMNRTALWNGQLIPLRPQSFDILKVLVSLEGEYVSREVLWRSVWKSYKNLPPQDTVINTALSRLRGNLSSLPSAPLIINNRLGYCLALNKKTG
jgi:DNA-binding response OmpR family regulator